MPEALSKSQRIEVLEKQHAALQEAVAGLQKLQPEIVSIARFLNEKIGTIEAMVADLHLDDSEASEEVEPTPAKRRGRKPRAEIISEEIEPEKGDDGEPVHV